MAEAILRGLLEAGVCSPERIHVSEPLADRRSELGAEYGVAVSDDNEAAVRQADIVILAVKPQVFDSVLPEIARALTSDSLVVSIAAGVPLAALERALPNGQRIVRTMPNTPALVHAGATGIAAGRHATKEDLDRVEELFSSVGTTVRVEEKHLDAVTGLSGSGPAYAFLMIEALADGGVRAGLPRAAALTLAAQTLLGAAKLVLESGEHPGVLKDRVASPGGTTIAGLQVLEKRALRGALIGAVEAATHRSEELGRLASKR